MHLLQYVPKTQNTRSTRRTPAQTSSPQVSSSSVVVRAQTRQTAQSSHHESPSTTSTPPTTRRSLMRSIRPPLCKFSPYDNNGSRHQASYMMAFGHLSLTDSLKARAQRPRIRKLRDRRTAYYGGMHWLRPVVQWQDLGVRGCCTRTT